MGDHTRSFLKFDEIHRTRSVCKQWIDIESVPKCLAWSEWQLKNIPPYASFTRITSFSMAQKLNGNSEDLLHRVLQHNRHHLRSLAFKFGYLPTDPCFPELPALEKFRIGWGQNNSGNYKQTLEAVLKKAPNLTQLEALHADFEIDLSICPQLKRLEVTSFSNVKDIAATNITNITFSHVSKITNLAQF